MHRLFYLIFLVFLSYTSRSQTITGTLEFCEGSSTTLSVSGAPVGATYQWQRSSNNNNWNNITGSTNSSLIVDQPDYYRVLVKSIATISVRVLLNSKPIPDFTFSNNACSGSGVLFTSNVTSGTGPFIYRWDFGDGTFSSAQNPTHIFNSTGCSNANFTVSLAVTDAKGCSNFINKIITIKQAPDVQVTDPNNIFSPFSNCNNNPTVGNPTFTITVANISPSISCINAYSLDWGDGTAIENNIVFPKTHTYTQLGAFKLVVSAVGSNGCVNSKSYTVANQSNPGVGFGTIPNTTTGLCAPAEIPLLISNWQNNSPGTTYSLTFGDGTSLFLTHPLNASLTTDTIKHTYTKSSCPNPTYTVILSVQNACSTTPYTAGNIQVSIKPFAAFNADTSACVGQKICFSNTTITGNTGTACSNATIYNWDFGDNTANSTEASPCHTYSKTGTYTLTLTASNPCGSSTIKKKICVVASPISSFTINNNEGCSPVSVTAANSSNTLNSCASATYFWSVSYVSNCGNVSMWSFTNNTNSGSLNPSFIFSNAGTYTVSLTVSNLCGSNTSTKTVTVKQAPLVLLNSLPAFCLPATVNPASLVTNCGTSPVTYNWTFPSGSPASSTLQNPGPVSYNNAGSFNILLAVTNECGSANASNTIIINPTPVTPSAGSNSPVCSGNSLNLTANSGTSGVIYNWAGPNGFSSNLQNPVRPNSTINMSGNYTVNSILNGCTSGLATIPVVVNQTPLAPVVNPAGPYCQNAVAVRLSANVSPGNTLRWYKTALGGQYSDTAFIPSTTTLGSTTYYVSQVSPGACESERSAITVSINPVPAIKGIYTDPTNCTIANGSIILSGVSAFVTYTIQYTKIGNTPSTISLSADGNGNLIIPGLSPGTYDNIFVNLSGCLSNQLGPFTLKNPQNPATPSAGSNSPLCSGISLKLTASSSSTGVGYNWTGPNGFTSSLQNPVIPNSTAIMGGIYNVTSVLNGCTSGTASTTVVVNQTPLAPTANTSIPYCQNAVAVRLAANVSPGNTLRWYKTATGGQYSDTAFIPLTNNLGSTTYYVSQVSASSCESERTSITVIINSVPRITGSSTNPSSCNSSDGMIDITGILPNTFYDVQYTKNAGPATLLSLQSNNSGHLLILNLSTGNYSNIIVTQNGCSSNIVGPFTIINPPGPPTPTISSNGPICSGNTLRLTASSAPGAAIYFWTGPNSFTSTLQNPTLDNLGTNGSGIYSLKITLNGCESGTTTTNVIVNQTPSAPSVTSPVGYCQNTTASPLSANADAGNQLLWYNSLIGGTSSSSAPIPNTAIVGTNTYYVSQVSINASCESSRMPIRVTINPVAIISATSTDPTNCTISNGLILISGVTAFVTYNISYTKNGGSTTSIPAIANGNGTITISGLSPGKFENISVSLNGCSSNMVGPLTLINPPIPATPSAGSNSPLCSGTALNLTANSITSGVDYTWAGPNNFVSDSQNPLISNTTTAMAGTYTVSATKNGCVSAPISINVTIKQSPASPIASSNSPLCSGNILNLTSSTILPETITYSWTGPNGFVSNLQNPSISNSNPVNSGTYNVISFSKQTNCSSQIASTSVVINALPIIFSSSYADPVNCISTSGIITLNGLLPITIYVAQYIKNGNTPGSVTTATNRDGNLIITGLTRGSYTNVRVFLNGCSSNEVGPFTLVESFHLPAKPTASGNLPLCVGNTLKLAASSITPGVNYAWKGPNGFASNEQNPKIINVTSKATGQYFVTAIADNCISDTTILNIIVNDNPIVNLGPDLILAEGSQHTMTSEIENGPISTYLWTPSTNLSCSNCAAPVANIKKDISYILTATNINGCTASGKINIKVICENTQVFIPDAFTPDGDGINDIMMVRASGSITVKSFRIFNKWGQLIFEKLNFPPNNPSYGWDGKIKGIIGPPDVFIYTAEVVCDNGSTFIYKGNISLLK